MTGITALNGASGQDIEDFDRSSVLGLVADVGGTHIRFGIAVGGSEFSPLNVHCVRRYPVRAGFEYKGRFTAAMRSVPLETIAHPHVELLCAARLLMSSR